MKEIYKISEKLSKLGSRINEFLIRNKQNLSSKDRNDLGNLSTQCFQLSDKVIEDHIDSGIAKDCFKSIVEEATTIINR